MTPDTLPERIRAKITPDPDTECWIWTGAWERRTGYGRTGPTNDRVPAHRYTYTALVGPITGDNHIHHMCGVRRCVNPEHLVQLAPAEHYRIHGGSAVNAGKTHCPQGHEYTPENTRVREYDDGETARFCRTCNREKVAAWRERGRTRTTEFGEAPRDKAITNVCKRGHDLTNAYVTKSGSRQCRECSNLRQRERSAARRAENPIRPGGRPRQEFCKRGHSLADAYEWKNGFRSCRECSRIRGIEYRAAKRAAKG